MVLLALTPPLIVILILALALTLTELILTEVVKRVALMFTLRVALKLLLLFTLTVTLHRRVLLTSFDGDSLGMSVIEWSDSDSERLMELGNEWLHDDFVRDMTL
jgi:apolipoprotein N-acyltransferase